MNKKKALGMGLEQLFNDNETVNIQEFEQEIVDTASKDEIEQINLNELRSNPYQPRKVFDEQALEELSSSIKQHGVFQPIIVKKSIKGYDIVAGERRVKASRMAGLDTIPAIVKDFTDEEMMQIALLENLQREDLNAIEEAEAYRALIETLNITQEQLAVKVGKSRSHITNMLGLLNLPREIKLMIQEKEISMGHARVLSKLENNEQIVELARKVKNNGLSVRELEELANNNEFKRAKKITRKPAKSTEYSFAEELLEEKLGTKVKIKSSSIEISFSSKEDLKRILDILDIKE